MNEKTYRLFSIVCYEESENLQFNIVLENAIKNNLDYFYIKHFPETEEKKSHYHLVIYSQSATKISTISNKLNIPENYINIKPHNSNEKSYTLKKTIGYLLHYNQSDKINYDISNIYSNREDLLEKYYNLLTNGDSEKSQLSEIIAFIDDNKPSIDNVLKFCLQNNMLKVFRKYNYVLCVMCKYN